MINFSTEKFTFISLTARNKNVIHKVREGKNIKDIPNKSLITSDYVRLL